MTITKCAMGVAWTSGLASIAITFALFTFFDPGDAVEILGLNADPGEFRVKAYIFMISLLWLVLSFSVAMVCFYQSLRDSNCGSKNTLEESDSEKPIDT